MEDHWLLFFFVSISPAGCAPGSHGSKKSHYLLIIVSSALQRPTLKSTAIATWGSIKVFAKGCPSVFPLWDGETAVFFFLFRNNAIEQMSCSFQIQFSLSFFFLVRRKKDILLHMWSLESVGCSLVKWVCSHPRPYFPRGFNLYQSGRIVCVCVWGGRQECCQMWPFDKFKPWTPWFYSTSTSSYVLWQTKEVWTQEMTVSSHYSQ